MLQSHVYEVEVEWTELKKGKLSSPDVPGTIEVATPPEFNGGIPGVWSPEHLFTAAVNSCLMTTFLAIAENSKLSFHSFTSRAEGKLEFLDGKYLMTEVILYPVISIEKGSDSDRALRVLEKSEKACLISNSITSRISMIPKIEVIGVQV
jgi:organic hydroperoxide reductase OsmC/OhrA